MTGSAENSDELITLVREIKDMIRLIAEPAIAARDKQARDSVRRLIGSSKVKAKATQLMKGKVSQSEIARISGMQKGNLSVFIKQLSEAGLLVKESRNPSLIIPLPSNFFDDDYGGA